MKILDGIKYVGKNFWKVLPVGSLINYRKNSQKKEEEANRKNLYYNPFSVKDIAKDAFHVLYALVGGLAITTLAANQFPDETYNNPNLYKNNSNIKQTEQVDTITMQNDLEKSVK